MMAVLSLVPALLGRAAPESLSRLASWARGLALNWEANQNLASQPVPRAIGFSRRVRVQTEAWTRA